MLLETAARLLQAVGSAVADEMTIVGGLVPGLLVPEPEAHVGPHAGTVEVDFGLSITVNADEAEDFRPLEPALRRLGYRPSGGSPTNRWITPDGIVVDFRDLLRLLFDSPEKLGPRLYAAFREVSVEEERRLSVEATTTVVEFLR